MKIIGKILLFFSSYSLLFLILLIGEIEHFLSLESSVSTIPNTIKMIVYSVLFIFSLISIWYFKSSYRFGSFNDKTTITIKSVSNSSQEIISYLITIVIPLIGSVSSFIVVSDWTNLFSTFTILIFISILYVNSNLVVVNPMLIIFGYSINKINFCYENIPDIVFEGVLLSDNKFDIRKISSTTIVNNIDENTFILKRV
ncbi:hypothetical protein [Methanococcoides alaskense]|uniref:Uncharacterized protein n=1 Tax=Methanococcoides alaskense TaxID=325778 RepID=A0AA90TXN5_9EURY|nr:hypothetical protein [Methanococcoides alaskense]MDA0525155.1 hypothetical protein [Methanococcoides alaskense]MDR6221924.1 hypothetical protein [Methanococcoides alaskense]